MKNIRRAIAFCSAVMIMLGTQCAVVSAENADTATGSCVIKELETYASKLSTPKGLSAKVIGQKIQLKWKAVSGAKGYNIYIYSFDDDKFIKFMDVKKPSVILETLEDNKKYKFRVSAYSGKSESGKSASVTAVTTIDAPEKKYSGLFEGRNGIYYFKNGKLQKGLKQIGNYYYYFDSKSGAMCTGEQKVGKSDYYFLPNGIMARSFFIINDEGVRTWYSGSGKKAEDPDMSKFKLKPYSYPAMGIGLSDFLDMTEAPCYNYDETAATISSDYISENMVSVYSVIAKFNAENKLCGIGYVYGDVSKKDFNSAVSMFDEVYGKHSFSSKDNAYIWKDKASGLKYSMSYDEETKTQIFMTEE